MFSKSVQAVIDLILPPRCVGSGEIVSADGMLAPSIWKELSFIASPFCQTCGVPFALDVPQGTLCGACLATTPLFTAARSAVVYNDQSKKLVLSFKYGDRMHISRTFLPWLLRAGADLITQSDVIIPVPLHKKRLWQRRFNQSAVLALALSDHTGLACLPSGLARTKKTTPQKGLSRKERHDNVNNAFIVPDFAQKALSGKSVLLIDDVMTSGATLNACTKTLLKCGAAKVFCLTVARVTREDFQ